MQSLALIKEIRSIFKSEMEITVGSTNDLEFYKYLGPVMRP